MSAVSSVCRLLDLGEIPAIKCPVVTCTCRKVHLDGVEFGYGTCESKDGMGLIIHAHCEEQHHFEVEFTDRFGVMELNVRT